MGVFDTSMMRDLGLPPIVTDSTCSLWFSVSKFWSSHVFSTKIMGLRISIQHITSSTMSMRILYVCSAGNLLENNMCLYHHLSEEKGVSNVLTTTSNILYSGKFIKILSEVRNNFQCF